LTLTGNKLAGNKLGRPKLGDRHTGESDTLRDALTECPPIGHSHDFHRFRMAGHAALAIPAAIA